MGALLSPSIPGSAHSGASTPRSTLNSASLLAALLPSSAPASSSSAASAAALHARRASPLQQQQQPTSPALSGDPWAAVAGVAGASASHHLPHSISQSINNPGLPSGVIVSSNAVNAMSMLNQSSATHLASPSVLSRSATPVNGVVAGGGKLLLATGAHSTAALLATPPARSELQHLPAQGATGAGLASSAPVQAQSENEKVYYLIVDLMSPATREGALLELSKKREQWDDLALVLWHSFGESHFFAFLRHVPFLLTACGFPPGVMSALLQEIVAVYPLLAPPSLTAHASNRVCNALALLQCVASHNDTRSLFLSAHIPLFLYPFLNTTSKTRPFEYLRLTSLGVIGALVKQNDNSDVINFLLSTEIIPLCLRIMETGSELSKTVAIFIVQKILLDEVS